jgi:hypothetical protein
MENNNQLVASKDVQRSLVIHPNGTITLLGGTDEQSAIDENGGTQTLRTTLTTAALDGHVLQNGDVAHQCPNCGSGPWSTKAMLVCTVCRRLVCTTCAQQNPTGTLCAPCSKATRRAALRAWLCSIL